MKYSRICARFLPLFIGITLFIACSPVQEPSIDPNLQYLFEQRLSPDNALTAPDSFINLSQEIQILKGQLATSDPLPEIIKSTRAIIPKPDTNHQETPTYPPPHQTYNTAPTPKPIIEPTTVTTNTPAYAPRTVTPTVTPTVIPTATPSATDHFNKGVDLYKRGRYREAILEFNSSLKLSPKHPKGYLYRGRALNQSGQTQKGLVDIEFAIRLSPDFHSPYVDQGNILTNLKQYEKATKAYSKAISLRPQEPEAYYHRASLYRLLGIYDKSNFDYSKACSLADRYCNKLTELGICSEFQMKSKHVIWGKATSIRVSVWLQGKQIAEVMTGGRTKINAPYAIDLEICDSNGNSRVGKNLEFKLDKTWARETIRVATGENTMVNLTKSPYR